MAGVDLVNDLQVPRQDPLDHGDRPALQGLGEQGVVGVGKRLGAYVPRLFPAHLLVVQQNAHEFGDGERRVSVVELNGNLTHKMRGINYHYYYKEA